MERPAVLVVLALGAMVLLATAISLALGHWDLTLGRTMLLLVVVVGMWRASVHLRRSLPAR